MQRIPAETSPRQLGPFSPLGPADWTLIASLSIFFFVLCTVRSQPRLLWGDELLGFRVLHAPTLRTMLRGWWEGADGGGLFYYLLARLWVRSFTLTELSLRLFSTAGMCLALLFTWAAARRYFSTVVVMLAISVVYLTPAVMLWQQLNGRFYGLFLASAALASLLFLIAAEHPPTQSQLVSIAVAHTLLIGSHVLGMVYSFSLLAGTLALDRRQHRFRPRLYLAELAGWIVVPISYHAIWRSSSIAADGFWTQRPGAREYVLGVVVFGKLSLLLLAALVPLALLRYLLGRRLRPAITLPLPVLYLLGSLALAQTILFTKSQFGTSIYADRYLLPVSVSAVLLFALVFQVLLPHTPGTWTIWGAQSLFFPLLFLICCCTYAISRRTNHGLYATEGYPQRLLERVPAGATVVSNSLAFELLSTYDPTHRSITPYNWFYGPSFDHHVDYSDQHLMENWKRADYEAANIVPCWAAFSQPGTFYVLIDPPQTTWFEERIAQNRAYDAEQIGASTEWQPLTLWSVRQLAPGPPPC